MLSYRHAFHAGNFADVFKHIALMLLLKALARKNKPYCYIDTHSGAGRYELSSAMARKNREFAKGIGRLWALEDPAMPQPVADYLAIIRQCNRKENKLRWYPGSPLFARHCMRSGDRLLLTELHPGDYPQLNQLFISDPQISVRREDGYQMLKAQTPPRERRGLVLLDPAYERRDEIDHLTRALLQSYRRWQNGCFMIWYPVMAKLDLTTLLQQLEDHAIPGILQTEFCLYPDDNPSGLNGSGLLFINPPWQLDTQLAGLLPWLWHALTSDGGGRYKVEWLTAG